MQNRPYGVYSPSFATCTAWYAHPTSADEADRRRPELLRVAARGGAVALVAVDAPRDGGEGVVEVADVAVPVRLRTLVLDPRGPRRRHRPTTPRAGRHHPGWSSRRSVIGPKRVSDGSAKLPVHGTPGLNQPLAAAAGRGVRDEDGGQHRDHHERARAGSKLVRAASPGLPSAAPRRLRSESPVPPRGLDAGPMPQLFDAVLERVADELLLPVEVELAQDVAHVVLDGLLGDEQLLADLLVRVARGRRTGAPRAPGRTGPAPSRRILVMRRNSPSTRAARLGEKTGSPCAAFQSAVRSSSELVDFTR